jgi:hypothetical protein
MNLVRGARTLRKCITMRSPVDGRFNSGRAGYPGLSERIRSRDPKPGMPLYPGSATAVGALARLADRARRTAFI